GGADGTAADREPARAGRSSPPTSRRAGRPPPGAAPAFAGARPPADRRQPSAGAPGGSGGRPPALSYSPHQHAAPTGPVQGSPIPGSAGPYLSPESRASLESMPTNEPAPTMRAVAVLSPGSVPQLMELPRPATGPGEVLVRLSAASVNPMDWKIARGDL